MILRNSQRTGVTITDDGNILVHPEKARSMKARIREELSGGLHNLQDDVIDEMLEEWLTDVVIEEACQEFRSLIRNKFQIQQQ